MNRLFLLNSQNIVQYGNFIILYENIMDLVLTWEFDMDGEQYNLNSYSIT